MAFDGQSGADRLVRLAGLECANAPMIKSRFLTMQAGLKQITVLPKVMQKPSEASLVRPGTAISHLCGELAH